MKDFTKPIRYERLGKKRETCSCCGKPLKFIAGMVYDQEDNPLASFLAILQEDAPPLGEKADTRGVTLRIGLELKDDEGKSVEGRTFCLILRNMDGAVITSVITETSDSEGQAFSREDALKSPFLPLIYAIDDFIVANEPDIKPSLGCT